MLTRLLGFFWKSRLAPVQMLLRLGFIHPATVVLLMLAAGWCASAHAYQERLVAAMNEGDCFFRVEADDEARTLRLRVQPEGSGCRCGKDAMQAIVRAAFSKTEPSRQEGTYKALFLGRLVSYPWLMHTLAATAATDPQWHRKRVQPVSMDLHAYVQRILGRPEVMQPFNEALRTGGYRVASVTVEKVGVARYLEVPGYTGPDFSGKVPYDAMVWLHLERH